MEIKMTLDTRTMDALSAAADRGRRPIPYQVEILLMRALGIQVEVKTTTQLPTSEQTEPTHEH